MLEVLGEEQRLSTCIYLQYMPEIREADVHLASRELEG